MSAETDSNKIEHKEHFHGSDLEKIEKIYGIKKEDIISFSANVNPLGISYKLKKELASHIDAITSYPDREYTSLRKCIAKYAGTDYTSVLVGNGSTELISLVIQIKKPSKALIVGPTYSEYEHEVALGGGRSHYFRLREKDDFKLDIEGLENALTSDIDLLVICNPNNPTSSQIDRSSMRRILDACKEKGIFVMVDETYIEFTNMSIYSSTSLVDKYKNLFVIRGTSKFFSTPGIRLGYGLISNNKIKCEMNSNLDLWNINIFASMMGEVMFNDSEFIESTYSLMTKERDYLINELSKFADLKIYNSQGNFILCEIQSKSLTAKEVREKLIPERIIIRDCVSFDGLDEYFFRVCILKPEENKLLVENLKKIFK